MTCGKARHPHLGPTGVKELMSFEHAGVDASCSIQGYWRVGDRPGEGLPMMSTVLSDIL